MLRSVCSVKSMFRGMYVPSGFFNEVVFIDVTKLDSSCFNGCYKDFVELIGHENTLILHQHFAGQYVSFPKKLLTDAYLHDLISKEFNGVNAKELARKYNYTYSWIMKLLKKRGAQ